MRMEIEFPGNYSYGVTTDGFDEQNYYAKALVPTGNEWRTPQLTREQAETRARRFVADWKELGKESIVGVFYRTGQLVCQINSLPDAFGPHGQG